VKNNEKNRLTFLFLSCITILVSKEPPPESAESRKCGIKKKTKRLSKERMRDGLFEN